MAHVSGVGKDLALHRVGSRHSGLFMQEAAEEELRYGPNEVESKKKTPRIAQSL